MKAIKRYVSMLLIVVMSITSFTAISTSPSFSLTKAEKIANARKKLYEKQKTYNEIRAQAGQKQKYKNQILNDMDQLEERIMGLETDLESLQVSIFITEEKIDKKNKEIAKTEKEISKKKEMLNARLRTMYKTGNVGYIEVVLGSRDFADFMTRLDIVQRIYKHDKEIVAQLNKAKAKLEVSKQELEAEKASLTQATNNIKIKRQSIKADVAELEKKRKVLNKDLAALEERARQLSNDAEALKGIISSLQDPKKVISKGPWAWPVPSSRRITAPYGYSSAYFRGVFHTGMDIGAPRGTTIVASKSGRVIYAGWKGAYGNMVMIDHGGGMVSVYAHQSRITCHTGQNVSKGQKIGEVGTTGNSTGNHLHFEIRKNGNMVNPRSYL